MKSSKTSVQSTTVRGMEMVAPAGNLSSGMRLRHESMKARPRPLPPMEPWPMRAKLL